MVCVVTEPPAGVGVVDVLDVVVVVDGGVTGVGAVVVVLELVIVVVVVAPGVVCATESGTAMARLAANTPAASNAFMIKISTLGSNQVPS